MHKIAVVITNYNMPERTDALCAHIEQHVRWPHDLIVVDNGSDQAQPSKFTALRIAQNVQTTAGWLMGLDLADKLAARSGEQYLAYWFLITSAEFPADAGDVLTPMAEWLVGNSKAAGVHPALTDDSTTSWKQLYARGGNGPRQTWMIDNIASLYRASWFDRIGRFDPALQYAWGIDLETCYLARMEKRSIWVHEGVRVKKVTDVGYVMNRMGMSANERRVRARENMAAVLSSRYGPHWWERMTEEFVEEEWK